LESRCHPFA
jgi:hypothetical protein